MKLHVPKRYKYNFMFKVLVFKNNSAICLINSSAYYYKRFL